MKHTNANEPSAQSQNSKTSLFYNPTFRSVVFQIIAIIALFFSFTQSLTMLLPILKPVVLRQALAS